MKELEILMLEDDFSSASEIEILLSSLGYTNINIFDTVDQATNYVSINKPDLLMIDVKLKGGKTGIDFAQSLVGLNILTIFFTSYDDKEIYTRAM